MSGENVETVRRGFHAVNRGDLDALLKELDPEIELTPSLVGGVEQTHFHGHEGYRAWFQQQLEIYDWVRFELASVRAVDDKVIAIYTTRVRARQSGIEFEAPGAAVFTFRAGRIVKQTGYQRPEEAVAAVGLTE